MVEDYDNYLYSILCNEQDISGFLEAVFAFLYRRTNFFKIESEDETSGSLAESLVKNAFLKYLKLSQEQEEISVPEVNSEECLTEFAAEEEVTTTVMGDTETVSEASSKISTENSTEKLNTKDAKIEEKVYVSDPKCYNGAQHENYCWSQTLKDADIQIKVSENITSGKQVKVEIKQQHIKAEALENDEWKTLVDDELKWKINSEQSIWTLVPKDHIHICLEKADDRWWECFFVSEPKIDIKSIDASHPYEELDEDSRAKIQELMYNEQQKRLGKPTISQEKISKVLKDAWDKDESPFKGKMFDPTICDIYDAENITLSDE